MTGERPRSRTASMLAFALCLSACPHGRAQGTRAPMDKNLAEGVFVGNANLPEPPVYEGFEVYEGPLPKDRDPSFWDLRSHPQTKDKRLAEAQVMRALLRHFDQDGKKDWEVGIGTGGQLYSWRGPWGEALPPQFGPWVDEVWQANFHSNQAQEILKAIYANDPRQTNIHNTIGRAFVQASAHVDITNKRLFPSPMVARYYNRGSKSYTTVNLALSASLPTLIYHNLLVYARYRYLGDGVLEVTNVVYSFGEFTYPYGGIPWGGVRTTVFPNLFVSRPDGSYEHVEQYYGERGTGRNCSDTDGWLLAAAKKDDPQCPAFAFAYGRDFPYEKIQKGDPRPSLMTSGRAGRTPDGKPNSRDFTIMANSVRGVQKPGTDYWVRYYLITGPLAKVVENARKYAARADYGVLNFSEERAGARPLYREEIPGGSVLLTRRRRRGQAPVCRVYDQPVLGSMPLFAIRELPEGKGVVTTDLYELSRRVKYENPVPRDHKLFSRLEKAYTTSVYESQDGKDLKWQLLGFVMPADKAKGERAGYVELASIVDGPGTRGMLALGPGGFDYSNLTVSQPHVEANRLTVKVTAEVTNTRKQPAFAAPRLYVQDLAATVPVHPVRRVAGRNILLQPGETKTLEFVVDGEALSIVNKEGARVVEPGKFEVMIESNPDGVLSTCKLVVSELITVKPGPKFEQQALALPRQLEANQKFSVSTEVSNTGGMRGIREFSLWVDGKRITGRKVVLPPGRREKLRFETLIFEPGEHRVKLGDREATVQVAERPATFSFSGLQVSRSVAYVGDELTASATVTNLGSAAGVCQAALEVGGKAVGIQDVALPAAPGGASATVRFTCRFAKAGTCQFSIGGLKPVAVEVLEKIGKPFVAFASAQAQMGLRDGTFVISVMGDDTFEWAGGKLDFYGAIARGKTTGDFAAVVRVDSQTPTHPYAKAGLMVRNDIAQPGSSKGYAAMCVTPERGFIFLHDANQNGFLDRPSEYGPLARTQYPVWLKLEKRGKVVSGYCSPDGKAWKRVASADMPTAASEQHVAIFATSNQIVTRGKVEFSGFSMSKPGKASEKQVAKVGSLKSVQKAHKVVTGTTAKPAELGRNLARHPDVIVTASSAFNYKQAFSARLAVDGNLRRAWCSRAEGANAWLELDLGRPVRITHVAYKSRHNIGDWVTRFTLTFDDGSIQEGRLIVKNIKRLQYFDIEDVTTRHLRWDALEAHKNNTGIDEFEIYGVPVEEELR